MKETIETRIHTVTETLASQGDEYPFPKVPIYCINQDIMDSIDAGEFNDAYKSVLNAGFGNLLPWPEIIIEFEHSRKVDNDGVQDKEGMRVRAICYMKMIEDGKDAGSIDVSSIYTMTIPKQYSENGVQKDLTIVTIDPINLYSRDKDNGDGIEIVGYGKRRKPTDRYNAEVSAILDKQDVDIAKRAHFLASTILNTSGIDKTIIEPTKLNQARVKSGKTPIPRHYVIRIAHTYARDGSKVKYERGKTKIHMRAGHTRQQPHGPNSSLRKPIWINAVLINYRPETVQPRDVKL